MTVLCINLATFLQLYVWNKVFGVAELERILAYPIFTVKIYTYAKSDFHAPYPKQ